MAESKQTGSELIAAERRRQVEEEGWTPEHDVEHSTGELLDAALCYARAAAVTAHAPDAQRSVRRVFERDGADPEDDRDFRRMVANPARHHFGWNSTPQGWPWDGYWNPSPDTVRNLVKAGALIAAEIDRLLADRED